MDWTLLIYLIALVICSMILGGIFAGLRIVHELEEKERKGELIWVDKVNPK